MSSRPVRESASVIELGQTGATGPSGIGGAQGPGSLERLPQSGTGSTSSSSFGDVLSQAIDKVNGLQVEADHQAELVATGEAKDLHTAAIAMERAELALQATVQITQKAIDAYREISRMQV